LGSNSLTELVVMGKLAGEAALEFAKNARRAGESVMRGQAESVQQYALSYRGKSGKESAAVIRDEMAQAMEDGAGIYRTEEGIQKTVNKIQELKERFKNVGVADRSENFNTEWLGAIELGHLLDVAQSIAYSALQRKESRGAHQRLDHTKRDDQAFLKHTLAFYNKDGLPTLEYSPVKITKSQPAERLYGAAGDKH
jgi:fumarate reductase flavoprotein subunit